MPGVGGALRRRPGCAGCQAVEALRRRGQGQAGAVAGRRRVAAAPHPGARLGGRLVLHQHLRPGPLRLRRPLHRAGAGLQPRFRKSPRCGGPPPRRDRGGGHPRLVRRQRLCGRPLRGRILGCVGGDPSRRPGPDRGDLARPARPGAGDRRRLPGGPHPGRRVRAPSRGPTPAQRPHLAPLPAVVPLLHPRRLDRHPLRRPLRHQPHPHRRLRRVGADDHPGRMVGVPPPARLRRGPQPRPHGDRIRRHLRHHHRGLDAHPAPADLPGHRRGHVRVVAGRMRGRPPHRAGQAVAGQPDGSSTRPRPAGPPDSTAPTPW